MPSIAVVGCQFGDEGKGKIVDLLAKEADMVVRYQGGNNAGHTVVHGSDTYKLHLIPSGILHDDVTCVIANGVVIDGRQLISEIAALEGRGIDCGNLVISDRAHLILPTHRELDARSEARRGLYSIGTTNRGIGPAYRDKAGRSGIRISYGSWPDDLLRDAVKLHLMENDLDIDKTDKLVLEIKEIWSTLEDRLCDTSMVINTALDKKENVIFEGAQGVLLDVDHGTYPYVTSSNTCAGAVCTGAGVGPTRIDCVIGVSKAYVTRVGCGPFPTKSVGKDCDALRSRGNEYGTTTGRPRDCGWLDLVALDYAARSNGLTHLAITKLDVLDPFSKIIVCYEYSIPGRGSGRMLPHDLYKVVPQYAEFDGWESSTVGAKNWGDLPRKARDFLDKISDFVGTPVAMVGTGPNRDNVVIKTDIWGKLSNVKGL